jgi:glycosyltransferase involved in cell wall biosynthesis
MQWIVSQIGAREHYAIPRAFHRSNQLARLYTDAWCRWGRSLLKHFPEPARSLSGRFHPEIPSRLVTSFTPRAIYDAVRERLFYDGLADEEYYKYHLDIGRRFASNVRDRLQRRSSSFEGIGFFGFSTGSRETLHLLQDTKAFTVLDQISPGRAEKEIVLDEIERWPGWATTAPVIFPPFEQRTAEEWEMASRVLVNSEWSKRALIEQGVPSNKIVVVPLAYEPPVSSGASEPSSPPTERPLRVLWLGSVNLRKGIQYLIEAAKRLTGRAIEIRVVGPLQITQQAQSTAPSNLTFAGRVPRREVAEEYRSADVFVLPTLSDGFAITQLEAMAHGLPVVTTPRCGRVVTNGEDGLIIPPCDSESLAEALAKLDSQRDSIPSMSEQALKTSRSYTIDHLGDRLQSAFS